MAAAPSDRVGRRFAGRYTVEARLGSGRGGEVFTARDERTGTRVALKVRDESLPAGLDLERSGLRSVEHPHLLRILDAGLDEGSAFVVTELLEGGALAQLSRPLAPSMLEALATQMLEALAFLHAQGILHGDVKPENILVAAGSPPRFVLADFGLAQRSVDVVAGTTRGSPAFMPPEIIRGEPADERSDLYSLGITLYECAFGELPFDDADVRTVLMRHLTEPPRRLQSPGDVGVKLVALLRRLLAKEPAERPVDARAALANWKGEEAAVPRWVPPRLGVLVGRDAELTQLDGALSSPDRAVVGIEGPTGIGKTRLLRELALRAELRGVRVVWWTAEGLRGGAGDASHAESSVGLLSTVSGDPGANSLGLAEARAREVLSQAGTGPVLVLLDDFDQAPGWLRDAAAFLLREATVQGGTDRLVCLTGCQQVIDFTTEALEAGGLQPAQSLVLEPWDAARVGAAASALLGARTLQDPLLELLMETTRGVPAEVESICQVLAERGLLLPGRDGTMTVGTAISKQELVRAAGRRTQDLLKRCSPIQLEVLQLLAALGAPAPLTFLDRIDERFSREIPTLHRLGALESSQGGTRFACANDSLRRAVLESLDRRATRALHDHIAAALQAGDDFPEENPLVHVVKGSYLAKAREAFLALREHPPADFVGGMPSELFERLLELWPDSIEPADRFQVEIDLLDVLLQKAEYDTVLARGKSALDRDRVSKEDLIDRVAEAQLARGDIQGALGLLANNPIDRTRSQFLTAKALILKGEYEDARVVCESLRSVLHTDDPLWRDSTSMLAESLQRLGEIDRAMAILTTNAEVNENRGDQRRLAADLVSLGVIDFYKGRVQGAEVQFLRALGLFSSLGDSFGMARALNSLAGTAAERGRYVDSQERMLASLDLCRRLGETENLGYTLHNLGQLYILMARYSEALSLVDEAIALMQRRGLRDVPHARTVQAGLFATIGLFDRALSVLDEEVTDRDASSVAAHALLIRSSVSLQRGRADGVQDNLSSVRRILSAVSAQDELVECGILESRLASLGGDLVSARKLASIAVDEADRLGLVGAGVYARVWHSELLAEIEPKHAMDVALLALPVARDARMREAVWRLERNLGRVFHNVGELNATVERYQIGLRVIQEITDDVPPAFLDSYLGAPERLRFFTELRDLRSTLEA